MIRLFKILLLSALLATTVLAHLSDPLSHLSALHKRHNKAKSGCHHSHQCSHIHVNGARPKCVEGRCTFECATGNGYKLSDDGTHCAKGCVNEPKCQDQIPDNSRRTCTHHGHCDFDCDRGYTKSEDGVRCEPTCKCHSSCHTRVPHANAICLPRGTCGFKCKEYYKYCKDSKTCKFFCTKDSACHDGHSHGHCNKSTGKCSFPQPTSSSAPMPTPTPVCNDTSFSLVGVSEHEFNKAGSTFSLQIPCPILDTNNYTILANGAPVLDTTNSTSNITLTGFTSPSVLLSVFAMDTNGNPIFTSFALLFGSISKSVIVFDSSGQPAPNVTLQANSTIYPGVGQTGVTDSTGSFTFINLIGTTLSLVARTADNQLAISGVSSTEPGSTQLTLIPFNAGGNSTLLRREPGFIVSTGGSPSVQIASRTFTPHPFTKTAYINYIFQTDEVPGGFFGTQYNDYFSLTVRSDTGGYNAYTNSMNALGLAAFDGSGATSAYSLTMDIAGASTVEFDVAVSNVADALLQSQVIVNEYGDLTCNICDDVCTDCPGDPMCQSSCQVPPPKSCSFYRTCAEAKMPCQSTGYALGFGEYFCSKYTNNIGGFTPAGQDWVYNVMSCLQKALIPVLTCDVSCPAIETAAFATHAPCYIQAGVCNLDPGDWMQIMSIVGGDARTRNAIMETIKEAAITGGTCIPIIKSRFSQWIAEKEQELLQVVTQAAKDAINAALNAARITEVFVFRLLP